MIDVDTGLTLNLSDRRSRSAEGSKHSFFVRVFQTKNPSLGSICVLGAWSFACLPNRVDACSAFETSHQEGTNAVFTRRQQKHSEKGLLWLRESTTDFGR